MGRSERRARVQAVLRAFSASSGLSRLFWGIMVVLWRVRLKGGAAEGRLLRGGQPPERLWKEEVLP